MLFKPLASGKLALACKTTAKLCLSRMRRLIIWEVSLKGRIERSAVQAVAQWD